MHELVGRDNLTAADVRDHVTKHPSRPGGCPFQPGDVVANIYTGTRVTVKRAYWQLYAGGSTSDYTVEFMSPGGWDKARNLRLIEPKNE